MIFFWGGGGGMGRGLGNDGQAFQSFNFKGDYGMLYRNLHFKQVSVQDPLFCACQ